MFVTAGDSLINQLVELFNAICQALYEGEEVHAVLRNKLSL